MTKNYILFISMVMLVLLNACHSSSKKNDKHDTLMVFSAASMTEALEEIIESFETVYPVKVSTNMASSGTLARQIHQGEVPGVYISASKKWATYIDTLGYVIENLQKDMAKNTLVMIAPKGHDSSLIAINENFDITGYLVGNRLSMGDPKHVPAGKYAQQALKYYGMWDKISSKVLPGKDVRSALMMVELGETPLGIVYKTDALKSSKVNVVGTFLEESHKPIVLVASVCKNNTISKTFYNYLSSPKAKAILLSYGFEVD